MCKIYEGITLIYTKQQFFNLFVKINGNVKIKNNLQ